MYYNLDQINRKPFPSIIFIYILKEFDIMIPENFPLISQLIKNKKTRSILLIKDYTSQCWDIGISANNIMMIYSNWHAFLCEEISKNFDNPSLYQENSRLSVFRAISFLGPRAIGQWFDNLSFDNDDPKCN